MRRSTILAVATVAALLMAPAVSSAQFRPFVFSPGLNSFGWPGYYGWPGLGGGYPYTFGGTSPWGGYPYGTGWGGYPYSYAGNSFSSTMSYYSIPNAGMPLTSLGGAPLRWNGVDLTGAGGASVNSPSYFSYAPVTTPKSGTLPAANISALDRTDIVPGDLHAHVRVRLPAADGEVTFEGQPVRLSNGTGRFVSPELDPGSRYAYEVRARWTDAAGKQHNEGRSVIVRAGQHVDVSFVPPHK